MTKKKIVEKPVKQVKKAVPSEKKLSVQKETSFLKKQYKAELTEEASKALERIMSFNPLKSKKEVASMIVLEMVKQYKGKKPPKVKK